MNHLHHSMSDFGRLRSRHWKKVENDNRWRLPMPPAEMSHEWDGMKVLVGFEV